MAARVARQEGRAEPVSYTTRRKEVRLNEILVPPEIAVLRSGLDPDHVEQMVLTLKRKEDLPPIKVALDNQGRYNRLTGGHRMEAHRQAGEEWIETIIYDDLPRRKWLAFALEDNRENALPQTRAERKASAEQLIQTTDMPDTEIARLCGFERHAVARWRVEIVGGSDGTSTIRPPLQKGRRLHKGQAGARARAYAEAHPGASKTETAKATGASESTVKRGRRLARTGSRPTRAQDDIDTMRRTVDSVQGPRPDIEIDTQESEEAETPAQEEMRSRPAQPPLQSSLTSPRS